MEDKHQIEQISELGRMINDLGGLSNEYSNLTDDFRRVLGKLSHQTLSWEEAQEGKSMAEPDPDTHFSKLSDHLRSLMRSLERQQEIYKHLAESI